MMQTITLRVPKRYRNRIGRVAWGFLLKGVPQVPTTKSINDFHDKIDYFFPHKIILSFELGDENGPFESNEWNQWFYENISYGWIIYPSAEDNGQMAIRFESLNDAFLFKLRW